MTLKNKLETKIRGWLPNTPKIPKTNMATHPLVNTNQVYPLPPQLENKFQRNSGIGIGLGLGVMMTGGFGTLISMQTYREVARYVGYEGAAMDNWLFRDLTGQLSIYLMMFVGGAICILWSLLALKSNRARQLTLNRNRSANGLMGGGGAIAFYSLRLLFMYLLTGDIVQLQVFAPFFAVGFALFSFGLFLVWKKK
ncbi:MAG TPA: hypothetical protein VLH35_01340 [Candidatus Acidoferrales bacterium]|nr:hypothetical protein [Candidatus Acidoferrales bacterium]